MLRAFSKVIYSILESKYGCDKPSSVKGGSGEKKGKQNGKPISGRGKKRHSKDDNEEEDSPYDI